MRRLSMKNKRRKSETASSESEENGGTRSDGSDGDVKNKKVTDNDIKELLANDTSMKRSPAKKRPSRGRPSLKTKAEEAIKAGENENVEDGQANEEKENGKAVKPSPSKRRKKEEQKATASTTGKPRAGSTSSEHEYEVEKIVGYRTIKGRRQFLVRWKGYNEDSDTWEHEKDLNCPNLIEDFLAEDAENNENLLESEKNAKSGKTKTPKIDKNLKKIRYSRKEDPDGNAADSEKNMKTENDNQKEFEVEKILEVRFKNNKAREFLIRWKGFTSADDTWEPEENLNCPYLIAKFMQKLEKAKMTQMRELRANPAHTKRYTLTTRETGRRLSRRNMDKQRQTYHECDE